MPDRAITVFELLERINCLERLLGEKEKALLLQTEASFLHRESYEIHHSELNDRITKLEQLISNIQGRIWAFGAIATLIAAGISLASKFWR